MAGPPKQRVAKLFSICRLPAAAPPSSCYDINDLVVVRVEDIETETVKEYKFFRKLLVWHSSYFAAALDPEGWFTQTDADVLELQDSHEVFDAFHSWMYTGRLMDPPPQDSPILNNFLSDKDLYDTWTFADLRGIPSLGNSAIDMLHERWTTLWYMPVSVDRVYENTSEGSKLRSLIVDWYSLTTKNLRALKLYTDVGATVEFLHEVYPLLADRTDPGMSKQAMIKVDRCRWHDHSGPGGKLRLEGRTLLNAPFPPLETTLSIQVTGPPGGGKRVSESP